MALWREQFAELSSTRYGALVGYATLYTGNGDDARDLVHDALLKVFGKARRFPSIGHAEAYVKRTIATVFIDGKRRDTGAVKAYSKVAERDEQPDSAHATVQQDAVHAALMTLSPRERACIVLRYYEDLTIADAAHALGISVGGAKKYLSDGRAKLAAQLGEIAEPEGSTVPVSTGRKS